LTKKIRGFLKFFLLFPAQGLSNLGAEKSCFVSAENALKFALYIEARSWPPRLVLPAPLLLAKQVEGFSKTAGGRCSSVVAQKRKQFGIDSQVSSQEQARFQEQKFHTDFRLPIVDLILDLGF
jgi:hypothetical protein